MPYARVGLGGAQHVVQQLVDRGRPFRARELGKYGVDRQWVNWMMFPAITRVARGVYAEKGHRFPRILIATARSNSGIASLYSALWLHGLLFTEPAGAWLSIGHKARKPRPHLAPDTRFFRTSHWPAGDDVCAVSDWRIPTTSLARTIVDFFHWRPRLGDHAAEAALEIVLQSGRCTLEDIEASAERGGFKRWVPLSQARAPHRAQPEPVAHQPRPKPKVKKPAIPDWESKLREDLRRIAV